MAERRQTIEMAGAMGVAAMVPAATGAAGRRLGLGREISDRRLNSAASPWDLASRGETGFRHRPTTRTGLTEAL